MEETKDIYVGKRKVTKTEEEGKTYLGKVRLRVMFDDDTSMLIPKEAYDIINSEEPIDATTLQHLRLRSIVSKMIVMITEEELCKDDIDALIQVKLPSSILEAKKLANKKLWGKEDHELTLRDIDNVLNNGEDN